MNKSKNFILILVYLIITILMIIVIIISQMNNVYLYPFNDFAKVQETMSLSKNKKNIVYIMADMTGGFDVTSILQSNKEMANNFTGFTNYLNVVTNNWGTNASVPNIFAGYDYNTYYKNHGSQQDITFRKYMQNTLNVLFSAFGQKSWNISAVANQYYHFNENSYWDSNWQTLESDFKQYHVQAINANDISRLLYYQYPEKYKSLNLPNQIFFKSSNINFIPITSYLSMTNIKETENNKFLTIMDESNHVPVIMNQFGNYQSADLTIKNIYNSTKGFLNKINDFITYLKINNAYDNTMIVINSDHGNNGTGSLPVSDSNYNHTGINYQDIKLIEKKYSGFTRAFPTLLVKPFNKNEPLSYDNSYLYTNADVLSFIKEYNNNVDFIELDQTKDPRYLKQLSDISNRNDVYLPSYKNDWTWNDNFTHYPLPNSGLGGYSFLVKKSIYDKNNYLVSKDIKDYYSPDNLNDWISLFL